MAMILSLSLSLSLFFRMSATSFFKLSSTMPFQRLYSCLYVLLLLIFCVHGHERCRRNVCRTITVDRSGRGDFSTIQSAIDSVPQNNERWVSIRIEAGIYREKVEIPEEKPFIVFKGAGRKKTRVVWDDHYTIAQSPTFASYADNIVVKGIGFVNSYNIAGGKKNPRKPAVAAMIAGDKTSFYRCGFYGVQDTLWDDNGRHYYRHCTIQGAVDFIFGSGQTIFENCVISVVGDALEEGLAGYITAQGRASPEDGNGFVFKFCSVLGTGTTFLGRPWRPFSRVVFFNSNLSSIVRPEGWDSWNFVGHENQLTYSEYGCYGPGAELSGRVRWEKKLSRESIRGLTSLTFIDDEGWLEKQPR